MAERKFAIRFSAEDMDKVRAALKGMGTDGAAALRAVENSSRQATPALRTVDNVAKDVRSSFDSLAGRIPIVGSALQGLGPIGLAVGAAFAGIGLGANALAQATRQAITDVSALKDAADGLQTNVETLQAVRAQGLAAGIDTSELDGMLNTLQLNSARASEGFGKMKAALDRVNPELSAQLATATSLDQRMNILARAMGEASSQNEKLNIAAAAFGANGAEMIRILDQSGASIDDWKTKAQEAGLVLDASFVEAVEAAGDRIERLQAIQKVYGQRLVADYSPAIEWWEQKQVDFLRGLSAIVEMTRSLTDQSEAYLRRNRSNWEAYARQGVVPVKQAMEEIARIQGELDRRAAIAAAKTKADEGVAARGALYDSNENYVKEQSTARAAARKKAAADAVEADKAAADAAKLREQQEKQAIEIRASLGDWTGKLAQREAELAALVKGGALSREEANAALAKYRGELDGSAATLERWKSAVDATLTPVEKAQQALSDFVAEAMLIGDRGPAFQAALRYYTTALKDAETAADEATPTFKAVAEARALIAREADAKLSIDERVAAEWSRQVKLVGQYGYTLEEAAQKTKIFRDELERQANTQRDASFEARFAAETMDAILSENMNSWEDLGKVALRVMKDMVVQWIYANQQMAKSQGLGEFIGSAFMSIFGGGGGAGAGAGGGGYVPTDAYAFHHAGTASVGPGSATFLRSVPVATFANAPRFHAGLAPDEFPSVLQKGERVLSVVHNERLVQAVERGGAPKVEVHFHGDVGGGKPEVKQSQNGDGSVRIDVMMKQAALDAMASPQGAKIMQAQYGIRRSVGG